jgi:hypothetical protein
MEKRILLESIPQEGLKDATHIDVEVYYTQGGVNYLSGGTTPRGYYLNALPVTHKGRTTSYALFSGRSKLLLKTRRYSAKQFERAVEMAKPLVSNLVREMLEAKKAL